MEYYHGTTVGDLKVLKPFAGKYSNLKEACVYFSTNKQLATVYIWNRPYKWMTFAFHKNGTPIYIESFPDSLKEFYGGVKGYIYICEGDFIEEEGIGIKYAAMSRDPVSVVDCQVVENAYELFLQYEQEGTFIINWYENLTSEQHENNRKMVMSAIKRLNLLEGKHPMSGFVQKTFPELWEISKIELGHKE